MSSIAPICFKCNWYFMKGEEYNVQTVTATSGQSFEIGWHQGACPTTEPPPEIRVVKVEKPFNQDALICQQRSERLAYLIELREANRRLIRTNQELRAIRRYYESFREFIRKTYLERSS